MIFDFLKGLVFLIKLLQNICLESTNFKFHIGIYVCIYFTIVLVSASITFPQLRTHVPNR